MSTAMADNKMQAPDKAVEWQRDRLAARREGEKVREEEAK